jgi:hypothetical protein
MGFFSFKKKKKTDENKNTDLPEIKKDDFIDDSEPAGRNNIITIAYGTGKPIDLIFAYLEKDYESLGYNDALCNPDQSYKEMNKTEIKSGFEILIERIVLKYEDDLSEINFHILSRSEAGLVDIVRDLQYRKDNLEAHKNRLTEMRNDVQSNQNVSYMNKMLLSYERGFSRGLAALSLDTLKIKTL